MRAVCVFMSVVIAEDAEDFEPRDVKPVSRDQWDGEDEEDIADVSCSLFMFSSNAELH